VSKGGDGVWIERWQAGGDGPRVAVKDLCDVEGSVTTAGCRALERRGTVAGADAACVEAVRRAGGVLVGKTNLHELAYGTSGANPWFGMPENPADPGRVPGGSSSGSAVAVARGDCDIGIGSDTGGSVRIPAACCGVVGLKTTWGRIPLRGVWPLAPSYDTIGPIAASVAQAALGLALLEGSAKADPSGPVSSVGRARLGPRVVTEPAVEVAVDDALSLSGLVVEEVPIDGWHEAWRAHGCLLDVEAWQSDGPLVEVDPSGVGEEVKARLLAASQRTVGEMDVAETVRLSWTSALREAVGRHGVLVLPTLPWRSPLLGHFRRGFNILTSPVNLCGFPALSVPVPVRKKDGSWQASLQLVGLPGSEELLLSVGAVVEAAVGSR
jgi:amidase